MNIYPKVWVTKEKIRREKLNSRSLTWCFSRMKDKASFSGRSLKQQCSRLSTSESMTPGLSAVTHVLLAPAAGDPLGQFAIVQVDEGQWGLIVKESLDREVRDRYALRVTATDGKFEAPISVDVHVLDINDNSPLCEQVSTGYFSSAVRCMEATQSENGKGKWTLGCFWTFIF